MAYLWTVTIGYVMILGMVGGFFSYFFRSAVAPEDATTIDPPKMT
ncbi:hypothetical protein [Peribacillus saganii]|nr:hypothetical protein [Peribacillus saganii]